MNPEPLSTGKAQDTVLMRRSGAYGLGILLSRLTGLLREVLLARALGTSPGASALVVAQIFPNLVRGLLSEEVAQGAIAPVLRDAAREDGRQIVLRLTRMIAFASTVALSLIALLAIPLTDAVVAPVAGPLPDEAVRQAAVMLTALLPVIATAGMAASGAALLVLEGRVGVLASLNTLSNMPLVLWLLVAPDVTPVTAAALIGLGLVLQAITQYSLALRGGARLAWPRRERSREIRKRRRSQYREVLFLGLPVTLALGAANLSGLVDTAFAARVGSDGPAALDKAFRLMLLPYGVLGLAISVAVMPALLTAVNERDFLGQLRAAAGTQIALLLPLAVMLATSAEAAVELVFAGGAFDQQSVESTARALVGMAFVMPALGLSALGTRAWTARSRPWVPAGASLVAMVANALLDWLLVDAYGLLGLALATAIVHTVLGVGLLAAAGVWSLRLLVIVRVLRLVAPAAFSAPVAFATRSLVGDALPFVELVAVASAIACVTVVGAALLGVPAYTRLLAIGRRRRKT